MDFYSKLARKPKMFLSVTGMNIHSFQHLLPHFEAAFLKLERHRKKSNVRTGSARQRRIGGGRCFNNDLANRLLMLLLYYRLYLTQDFMTLFFQAQHKSLICRNIQQMKAVFEAVLPTPEGAKKRILALAKAETQRRKKRIGSMEEFKEAYPELTFIIDGVEQPRRKPKDKEKRQSDYSGKKKRHTRKQLLISTPNGIIVDQSPSCGGRTHDFQAFKDDHASREPGKEFKQHRVTMYGDSGFQGMQDLDMGIEVRLIQRARRNHPLTRDEKKLNHLRSSTRVKVEHTISRRKKYRIAAEEYRNRDGDYDQSMNIVAGLVNLRAYERIFQTTGVQM
ncbi:MAG: transposase family protein [Pyrinomonadaceae bacterium]